MTRLTKIQNVRQLRATRDDDLMRMIEEARKLLGEPQPDKVPLAIMLPEYTYQRLEQKAKEDDRPIAEEAVILIEQAL